MDLLHLLVEYGDRGIAGENEECAEGSVTGVKTLIQTTGCEIGQKQ